MKFHGIAAKQKPEESAPGADFRRNTYRVLSIPVTQMPGIQLSLAQGNGSLRTDL